MAEPNVNLDSAIDGLASAEKDRVSTVAAPAS
jgi:hypothetical protein